jgi:hypothetical protein
LMRALHPLFSPYLAHQTFISSGSSQRC